MLTVKDLKPLDFIISYKEPTNFFEKIGNAGIKAKGKQVYPSGVWRANHVRVVEGLAAQDTNWGFEWTHPRSQRFPMKEWMLTPGYSWVLRRKNIETFPAERVRLEVFKHLNKRYDYLQLLGIYIGWKWLQFGEAREVCSPGAREIYENTTHETLFTELERWQTLPCSWLNNMHKFEWLNEPQGKDIELIYRRMLESRSSLVVD